jgi:hypothetical protein
VQVGVLVDPLEGHLHGVPHPDLVEVAHVEHLDLVLREQVLLTEVDVAQADLPHVVRVDGGHGPREVEQGLGPVAGEDRDRHPVHVAGGGDGGGVVVGVRVEPQHAQPLPRLAAVPCRGRDRADGQAVVAAEHDR